MTQEHVKLRSGGHPCSIRRQFPQALTPVDSPGTAPVGQQAPGGLIRHTPVACHPQTPHGTSASGTVSAACC